MMKHVLAVDLGASSGRVMIGRYDGDRIKLEEAHRFTNDPVTVRGTLYWDVLRLYHELVQGLGKISRDTPVASLGIDTWGCDYGLLDASGDLLQNPVHYRDDRTNGALEEVREILDDEVLYGRTGIQLMEINTLYQLFRLKRQKPELLAEVDTALMMPDLLTYFLTGEKSSEYTIASTSGLLDPHARGWDRKLLETLGLPQDLFAEVVPPGTDGGRIGESLRQTWGLPDIPVTKVASHDTASAVMAVPMSDEHAVYLSSSTWSLMGKELSEPMITPDTRRAMLTNEGGYDDTIRFLKNIMGLWLIQESRRQWMREGKNYDYATLTSMAENAEPFVSLIDPDDPLFAPPGDMPARIRQRCRETSQPEPQDVGAVARCIFESLAIKYGMTKQRLDELTGHTTETIHIVGGGCQNELLSKFTADASGCRVMAGPVEATAIGNVMAQLIRLGEIKDMAEGREIVARSFEPKIYTPGDRAPWEDAAARFRKLWM